MGRQSAWGISIASFNKICIDLRLLSGAWLCGLFFYGWDTLREKIQPALQWKISEAKSRAKNPNRTNQFSSDDGVNVSGDQSTKVMVWKNSAEFLLYSGRTGESFQQPSFTEHLQLMHEWDLWETLEGQINFSSVENMNKVTALHHKFKIYWVDLQLNEIPRTTSQYNFTCWLNKHAMSFDAQLTAAQPPQLNSVLWLILSYICLIAEGKRNSTKYLCSVTLNIKDLQ